LYSLAVKVDGDSASFPNIWQVDEEELTRRKLITDYGTKAVLPAVKTTGTFVKTNSNLKTMGAFLSVRSSMHTT
jgi:hypothetical protein